MLDKPQIRESEIQSVMGPAHRELMAPVAAQRISPAARMVYDGGYDGLGAAWGEIIAWVTAEGYTPGPDLRECYVAGPESSLAPAAWRTGLNRRLIGQGPRARERS